MTSAKTSPKATDPLSVALGPEWRRKAACRDSAPTDGASQEHPWFPTRRTGESNHAGPARAACSSCPVKAECLLYAVAQNVAHGVWGGAAEPSRRQLRRAFVKDGMRPGPRYELAASLLDLRMRGDRTVTAPVDKNGPGAQHGKAATAKRGCPCPPCRLQAAWLTQQDKYRARAA